MTTRRALLRRPWLTLLLAAQLVGVAVPLADAWLERVGAAGLRIAAPSDEPAQPVHVDGACALCQHLDQHRSASLPSADPAAPLIAGASIHAAPARRPFVVALVLERGRSPPTI